MQHKTQHKSAKIPKAQTLTVNRSNRTQLSGTILKKMHVFTEQ